MAPAGAKAKAEARAEATAIRHQNQEKYVRTYVRANVRNYSNALIWPKPKPKLGKASLFELTYEMAKSNTHVVTLTDASPQEC